MDDDKFLKLMFVVCLVAMAVVGLDLFYWRP